MFLMINKKNYFCILPVSPSYKDGSSLPWTLEALDLEDAQLTLKLIVNGYT